ncbi:hypothetical protein R6Q57_002118, partial [Mikania cordata]
MEHKSWLSLLSIMTLMTMFLVLRSQAVCIEEERKALLEIKASLINSHGYGPDVLFLPTWVDNGECCDWERVKCNKTTGHVTTLLLKNLKGNLEDDMSFESKDPSERLWPLNISIFLHFEELGSLDLSWNYLDNDVLNTDIETLSRLEKLEMLDLSSNFEIDNDILPSLTTLVSLKVLNLSFTNLEGDFPINGMCSFIFFFGIVYNKYKNSNALFLNAVFENGFILKKLETLILDQNSFNETVISSLKFLPSLTNLDLSRNKLYGSFPTQDLAYLTNLEKLDLSGNSWLTTISSIQDCKRLSSLKRLESIILESSNFNKSIISCLQALPSLKILDLRDSRTLVVWYLELPHMHNLKILLLGNNLITGRLSNKAMASFPYLEILDLSNNNLSGNFPSALSSLQVLYLAQNYLDGSLTPQ